MTDGAPAGGIQNLPYRIAVLCYLYDRDGRVLLLHRAKAPNKGMYSPVGGKLEAGIGEGPHHCAAREIEEETGLVVAPEDLHLAGVVSEAAYEGETHWLMFLFEVERPVEHDEIRDMHFDEGQLEWVELDQVAELPIPETDRLVMWPLVQRNRKRFFAVHIDCAGEDLEWCVTEGESA